MENKKTGLFQMMRDKTAEQAAEAVRQQVKPPMSQKEANLRAEIQGLEAIMNTNEVVRVGPNSDHERLKDLRAQLKELLVNESEQEDIAA